MEVEDIQLQIDQLRNTLVNLESVLQTLLKEYREMRHRVEMLEVAVDSLLKTDKEETLH